jgi:glucosamine kinase
VAYYIGMDGGATKTLCAIGTKNEILATATAGPSTLLRASPDVVRQSLSDSVAQACAAAGIRTNQITAACLGSTGAARSDVARALHDMLAELLPKANIQICGDMEIALAAAFGAGPGVVVVSGTGSIAFGRNADQRTARAGGLGPDTSDEGSGYWIGKRAMTFLKSDATASPAALVPAVLAEAEAGNTQARDLLAEAGAELASLASTVCEDLFGPSRQASSRVEVAMAGGVFKHSSLVRASFIEQLTLHYPRATVRSNVTEPTEGALWMARRIGRQ